MSSRNIVRLVKYACTMCFTVAVGIYYLYSNQYSDAAMQEQYRLLSDALAIPGYIMILAGGFIWTMNHGALDGISYGLKFAIGALIPGKRVNREENYADYVAHRREKAVTGYGFLLVSGLVAVGLSMIFLALYYSV